MADVTGELGGQPILLENAATEATLHALLQATLANSSSRSEAAKIQRAYEEALKKTSKSQKDNMDALNKNRQAIIDEEKRRNDLNKQIEEEKERRKKMINGMLEAGQLLGNLVGKTLGYAFSSATPKITDFTDALSGIPIIGPIIGAVGKAMQDTVDKFRELSSVGADFGGGIHQMRYMAANAGLSLETYTKAVVENGQSLALMSGSTAEGAKVFTAVNASMKGPFATGLARLGFSMEEQAELTAAYLAQQTRLGRAQNKTQGELNEGAQQYLLELDRLARVTGMSRKEAQAALDKTMEDKRMIALTAKMEASGDAVAKTLITAVTNVDKDFGNAILDLVANKGVVSATNTMTQSMALMNPELVEMAKRISNQNISLEEAAEILRRHGKRSGDLLSVMGDNIAMFQNNNATQFDSITTGVKFKNFLLKNADVVNQQTNAMNNQGRGMAELDRQLLSLKNELMRALTPAFMKLSDIITKSIPKITKFVEEFVKILSEEGLPSAIKFGLGKLGELVAPFFEEIFKSMFTNPYVIGGLVAGFAILFGSTLVQMALARQIVNAMNKGPGGSPLPDVPGGAGKVGRIVKGVTIAAIAGYGIDAGAGLFGVGKDDQGNDIVPNADQDEKNWKTATFSEKIQSSIPRSIETLAGFIGLSNMANQAKMERIAKETAYLKSQGRLTSDGKPVDKNSATPETGDMKVAAEVVKIHSVKEVRDMAQALKDIDYNRLIIPDTAHKSIETSALKMRQLRGEINAMRDAFKDLNNTGLDKITQGLGRLDSSFKSFNKSFIEEFLVKFKELDKKTQEQLLTDLNEKMDELNTNVRSLISIEEDNNREHKRIKTNTARSSGKV